MGQPLPQYFTIQGPMILTTLGCLVVALAFWDRAPLGSLLVTIACAITLIGFAVFPLILTVALHTFGSDAQSRLTINNLVAFGWSLFRSAYMILLVVAVYVGRPKA
jgi:hypothetical protein